MLEPSRRVVTGSGRMTYPQVLVAAFSEHHRADVSSWKIVPGEQGSFIEHGHLTSMLQACLSTVGQLKAETASPEGTPLRRAVDRRAR